MEQRIVGTTMPVLEFLLGANDAIISEAGELSWMSQTIQMTTHTQMAGGGGILGALKRVAGGGAPFMNQDPAIGGPRRGRLRRPGSRPHPPGPRRSGSRVPRPPPWLPLCHRRSAARGGLPAVPGR